MIFMKIAKVAIISAVKIERFVLVDPHAERYTLPKHPVSPSKALVEFDPKELCPGMYTNAEPEKEARR